MDDFASLQLTRRTKLRLIIYIPQVASNASKLYLRLIWSNCFSGDNEDTITVYCLRCFVLTLPLHKKIGFRFDE